MSIEDYLKKLPCLIHKNQATQTILKYNPKTGSFKVRCDQCKSKGITNILTGTAKKR